MSGILVDMDAVAQSLWAKDNNAETSKTVGQQVGMMTSAFEHRIPELFFTNEENPGEAVSAVKALALASAQGQRIYQVTSANVGVLDGLSIGEEVKDEIRAAVAVGREATVSEGTITVAGWTGVGYIVSDPETGAGAYRISGGENGGELKIDINWDPLFAAFYAVFFAIGFTLAVLPFILIAAIMGPVIIATLAVITTFWAWIEIRTHLPVDSAWRTFLLDIFGGLFIGILGLIITGLTLSYAWILIALVVFYAILDVFAPNITSLLPMKRRSKYA